MVGDKKNKILIVDDDPLNIMILEEILNKDYELVSTTSGQEAVTMAENLRPDLILLDIMLPGVNGFDVCRELRNKPRLQFTKIILISAKSLLSDRLEGYESGADDYISKPFNPDELLAKIKIFIRLKSVEEIERVKDDLINVFSHETRTPLNAILGFAKLLRENQKLTEEEIEGVNFIIDNSINLLELSNKTILLQSLRKGNRELSLTEISLDNLLKNALRHVTNSIEKKNININTNIIENATVSVDSELIETSITFLLDNAIKYSDENSSVDINAGINPQGMAFMEVHDHGKGIPEDQINDLFDEFDVEDVSYHNRGHGLSLSIVRYIIDLHQGDIKVVNNEDSSGATFTLLLSAKK